MTDAFKKESVFDLPRDQQKIIFTVGYLLEQGEDVGFELDEKGWEMYNELSMNDFYATSEEFEEVMTLLLTVPGEH